MKILRSELSLPALISFALVVAMLPVCANYSAHHPDERHYTDAAIQMTQSDDYLTPRTPTGELRFRKPIATYWFVAAGYSVFGVNPFGSRVLFVVAGSCVVFLTYLIADALYKRKDLSILSAVLVAIHPAMLATAPRSIPDIVLALCLTISTLGFVRFVVSANRPSAFLMLGYVGAGLAVQSKGLPGVVFLVSVLIAIFATDRTMLSRHKRQHVFGAIAFSIISLSWFCIMWLQHGSVVVDQFFGDQVAKRVSGSWWQPALDLPKVGVVFLLGFAPWLPLVRRAVRRCWKHGINLSLADRRGVAILVSWCVVFLGLACFVHRVNMRYQMAIAPMATLLIVGLIGQLKSRPIERHAGRLVERLAFAVVFIVIVLGVMQPQLRLALLGCTVLVIVGNLVLRSTLNREAMASRRICILASSISVIVLCLVPIAYFSLGAQRGSACQTTLQVLEERQLSDQPIVLVGKPAYAARLRVQSNGNAKVTCFRSTQAFDSAVDTAVEPGVLMIASAKGPELNLRDYDIINVPHGFVNLKPGKVISTLLKRQLSSYLDSCRQSAKIAIHKRFVVKDKSGRV